MKYLILHGADCTIKDMRGNDALADAMAANHSNVASFLRLHRGEDTGLRRRLLSNTASLHDKFMALDADQDGELNPAEFGACLTEVYGMPLPQATVDKLFSAADKESDGSIEYHEFVNFLTQESPMVEHEEVTAFSVEDTEEFEVEPEEDA